MSLDTSHEPDGEETPTPQADTPTVDWEKRYTDLQPEYTRTRQTLSDREKLIAHIEQTFPDMIASEEPDEPVEDFTEDDEPAVDPRVAQHDEWIRQQQEQQQQQVVNEQWEGWRQFVTQEAAGEGVELTPREVKAFQLDSVGENGLPVPQDKAKQILQGYLKEREEWVGTLTRKRPRVPHVPSGGAAAVSGKDPSDMTRQERESFMLDRLRAETS